MAGKRKAGAQVTGSYKLTDEQRDLLINLPEPITVMRAAEILGQSESSIYNAIDAKRLRSVPYRWNERTMHKVTGKAVIEWVDSKPLRRRA